jgi:hypothetical protein
VRISEPALVHLVTAMIAQQGQIGPQGSIVLVAEYAGSRSPSSPGCSTAFTRLARSSPRNDLFFVNEGGSVGDTLRLLDGYHRLGALDPRRARDQAFVDRHAAGSRARGASLRAQGIHQERGSVSS